MCRQRSFPTAIPCILLVASIAAQSVAAEPTPEARAHLKAGLEYLDGERYDEAYRELKAAYAIAPKPKLLANIGIAAEHLERDGEAIDAYQGCLDADGLTEREAQPLRQRIERLQASIATVTIEGSGTLWIVDTRLDPQGQNIVNQYGPFEGRTELRLRPGQHELQLERAEGATPPAWSVALAPGETATHSFVAVREPAPEVSSDFDTAAADAPPEKPARSHVASYVLWGAGAAGAVVTSIALLEAKSAQHDADEAFARSCPVGATPADPSCAGSTGDGTKAAHWRTAALVTGVGAIGALAGATVLYLLSSDSDDAARAEDASLQPWISPTGVGLSGRF